MSLLEFIVVAAANATESIIDGVKKHNSEKLKMKYAKELKVTRIKVPKKNSYYKNKSIKNVQSMFTSYGFENIIIATCTSVFDFQKGKVKQVTIGGLSTFSANDEFFSNEKVGILYYE